MALGIGYLGLIGGLVAWSLCPAIAVAQIVPDGSLGAERSRVNPGTFQGLPADLIDGGARRGPNLFHSFRDFNVGDRQRVYFADPTGVTNILARVTGSNASNIQGTLGVNGPANLYLLNPNGILFGPNARLDIRGSLMVSTADSLNFGNGFRFSASNPQAPSLLTVSVPIGLQYGTNPGGVRVQQSNLQVGTGQTLALVGGEVDLVGIPGSGPVASSDRGLATLGGRIELGSVAAGSLVSITPTNPGWELGYQGVQQFQDMRLTQEAWVNANGNGGGSIQMQGRRISIAEGSQVVSQTQRSQAGQNLIVHATELVEVLGDPVNFRSTRLATENAPGSTGNAGNLIIQTKTLRVADGGVISANTFAAGRGGDLTVQAKSIEVIGINPLARGGIGIPSSLSTQVSAGMTGNAAGASGNAGNLTIETETLRVADGGQISVATNGRGNGGNLTVRAKSIEVTGIYKFPFVPSSLSAQTSGRINGNAGEITLITDRLQIANQGEIITSGTGSGNAGNITIQANSQITLTDRSRINSNTTTGQGNIALTTPLLLMRRGSSITTTAAGTATGGNITIKAGFLVSAPNENNDIIANAFDGSGGRIAIATNGLFWFDILTRQDLQRLLNTTNPVKLDPRQLLTNDITAFSQANPVIDTGTVTLQTPNLDSLTQVTPLPTNFSDPSQLIATTCPADRGSSFAITGRGGLPEDPRQPLMGQVIWQDERDVGGVEGVKKWRGREVEEVRGEGGGGRIVEAQGWVVNPDGTIALVAPHFQESFVLRYPSCALSNP